MADLSQEKCKPCEKTDRLGAEEITTLLTKVPTWALKENAIEKEFRFKSYLSGLGFAVAIGKLAEIENHHPDIWIGWRRVKLTFTTHVISGLSRNDFIMASKAEQLFAQGKVVLKPEEILDR